MKIKYLIYFSVVFLFSCSGTKKMTKKAIVFEEQGMYKEASEYYLDALKRKNTNLDASLGLKRTGQIVMDELLSVFFKFHSAKEYNKSVSTYFKVKEWQNRIAIYKINIEIPSYYESYYNEDLSIYLAELYDEALYYLDKEQFDLGSEALDKIISLKSDYKDVLELKSYSKLEPLYQKANIALENHQFRKAYSLFNLTLSYKDSDDLKVYALKEAQYPIAMLPFENATMSKNAHKAFESHFLNLFINNKGLFIKIIDRIHIETILAEQELGISGMVDSQTAAQAGELFGAKAILVGRLVSFDTQNKPLNSIRKKGWESYQQKEYNAQTKEYDVVTKYKKVYYDLYYGRNEVSITIEYKLISTETGEILSTNLISETRNDEVNYISFNGSHKSLFSGSWKSKSKSNDADVIDKVYQDRRRIQNLLKSNRELISIEKLKNTAFKIVCDQAVNEIISYNPEED